MAKRDKRHSEFLRWTKHIPATDVQDPLGTSLRGSTRIANRLLFCITSITPRARYFAFLPWCVNNYTKAEKGQLHALGLRSAIILREHALTLGCVVHHEGSACAGGGLVGSREAIRWCDTHSGGKVNLRKLRFAKVPALDAYFNSLVNLGFFVTDDDLPEVDDNEEPVEITFDDLELTPLGHRIAGAYGHALGRLDITSDIVSRSRTVDRTALKTFGARGGLCELAQHASPDRELLRDVFFARMGQQDGSHAVRRQSLLLIMDTVQRFVDNGWRFSANTFAESVYFGMVQDGDDTYTLDTPEVLHDIAFRWRMFYFHYYMAVALEGVFRWLILHLGALGIEGATFDELVNSLNGRAVRNDLQHIFGWTASSRFTDESPASVCGHFGYSCNGLGAHESRELDKHFPSAHVLAETMVDPQIRQAHFSDPATGFALSNILLMIVIGRFKRWEKTRYGKWLATASVDPYVDLVPPVVLNALERRFDSWWTISMGDLASFVLRQFVIKQHQAMSYEKAASGARCLIQKDGDRIMATGQYDKIGIGNARFPSAVQVLLDLDFLGVHTDGDLVITQTGRDYLRRELEGEARK